MSEELKGRIAVVTDSYTTEIKEYTVPEPDDNGLVIKIEAAAICGSDQHNLEVPASQPRTIGHEFVGRIIRMGKNANQTINCYGGEMKIGDRIVVYPHVTCGHCRICLTYGHGVCLCDNDWMYGGKKFDPNTVYNNDSDLWPHFKGGFADYVYILPNTYVWKVPEDMPSRIAVLLDPLAVAMRAVEQAMTNIGGLAEGISSNSHALVIGAGPIGVMAGMILKNMGIEQLVFTDFIDEKLAKAKEISGADTVLNTKGMSLEEMTEKMNEITDGGPDIVIACANHPSATVQGLAMIRKLGTYVEIGAANGEQLTLSNKMLFKKNVHITSVQANTPQCYNRCMGLLKRWREMPFDKLVTHTFSKLEDLVPTARKMRDIDYLKGVFIPEE